MNDEWMDEKPQKTHIFRSERTYWILMQQLETDIIEISTVQTVVES